jgi:hypothetical protein
VLTRPGLPKFAAENRLQGTPDENKAIVQGSIALYLRSQGAEARSSTPDEFTSFVRAKVEAARQVAISAGIRA